MNQTFDHQPKTKAPDPHWGNAMKRIVRVGPAETLSEWTDHGCISFLHTPMRGDDLNFACAFDHDVQWDELNTAAECFFSPHFVRHSLLLASNSPPTLPKPNWRDWQMDHCNWIFKRKIEPVFEEPTPDVSLWPVRTQKELGFWDSLAQDVFGTARSISIGETSDHCFLLKHGSRNIGIVRVQNYDSEAVISDLALQENQRGKGYGKQALQAVLLFLKLQNQTTAILAAQKPLLPFYNEAGFTPIGVWNWARKRGISLFDAAPL